MTVEKGDIIVENNEKDRDIIERKRKEIIDIARKTNLAEYLLSKGVRLVRNGRRYKDAEHEANRDFT
jgi:transposase-like protein